ncbi:type II toxin-antitoxin system YafQ family toxin [Carnobacteriaceae bacterium zg-ZUI252]|nr:type II toxin-antitoxin system YafQ family toxin [Carnobacteriaceae bacterium zg-ZUI252]MBS4769582.1 type II toxin-antitoxin system YafQ family toxin [Carnobacteriaceae bacterium zg-ZUI240]QTU83047.1 type II toxin-antitoxin system YafQ family toxin [Carnobacteriaceae bacterium zg-C25]
MLQLVTTSQFRKDLKRMKKRNRDLKKLQIVLDKLMNEEVLDAFYRDHTLVGNYIGFRECHIEPDWLLIYAINQNQLILTASRTGSHSDLF